MATPSQSQHAYRPSVQVQMVDAVYSATSAVDAFNALSDLMMIQSGDAREDLAHVDRNSLAYLLRIVSAEISKDLNKAIAAYEADVAIKRQRRA